MTQVFFLNFQKVIFTRKHERNSSFDITICSMCIRDPNPVLQLILNDVFSISLLPLTDGSGSLQQRDEFQWYRVDFPKLQCAFFRITSLANAFQCGNHGKVTFGKFDLFHPSSMVNLRLRLSDVGSQSSASDSLVAAAQRQVSSLGPASAPSASVFVLLYQ